MFDGIMLRYIYNESQILDIWKRMVADDLRFENYDEAVKLTEFWQNIAFGEKQGEILVKFKTGDKDKKKEEYKEEAEQREMITNSKTPYVYNRLKTVFLEVDRCDGKKDEIEIKGVDQGADVDKLRERINDFFGEQSLDDYMDARYFDWLCIHMNSFLLLDFYDFDNETDRAWTYPLHVPVKDVRAFEYYHGALQYLAFQQRVKVERVKEGKKEMIEVVEEWLYTKETSYKLFIKPEGYTLKENEKVISMEGKGPDNVIYLDGNKSTAKPNLSEKKGQKVEYVIVDNRKAKFHRVPAMRIGDRAHPEYPNLKDSLLRPARERFVDLAQKKSNFDVTMALHGIAQKFVYVESCDYQDEKGKHCSNGRVGGDVCRVCDGTGKKKLHKSEFDVITLELTLDKSQTIDRVIDLSQLVHYAEFPQAIVDKHHEVCKEYEQEVSLSMFNTNVFDRSVLVAATATEIRANLTPVNNVLFTQYATPKSNLWEFAVRMVAHNADYNKPEDKLKVNREYPTDFSLESYQELLTYLKEAKDANAPRLIIRSFEIALIKKLNRDDHEIVDKMKCVEEFKPYNDRSENDRIQALTALPSFDPKKILWLYFDDIIRDLEMPKGNETKMVKYWRMEKPDLKAEIDKLVELYTERYKTGRLEDAPPPITIPDVELEAEI